MSLDSIVIKGAREHNLKNVDLVLPRNRLIVVTGLSGSGQIVAGVRYDLRRRPAPLRRVALVVRAPVPRADGEARRRLHRGLSPAISIDQKSTSRNPRSTVGTVTEIYDYLRLLFARVGTPHCYQLRSRDQHAIQRADRRFDHGAAGRHAHRAARAACARAQGRVRQAVRGGCKRGFRARARRRRDERASRENRSRQEAQAHDRGGRRPSRH